MMNDTMTRTEARNAYRTLAIASGLPLGTFNFRCSSVLAEIHEDRPEHIASPGEWLLAAREVSIVELRKVHGRTKGEEIYLRAELRAFSR